MQHQIPLLYQPFRYSTGLKIHEEELHYGAYSFSFRYRTPVWRWPLGISSMPMVIYVCPYFPNAPHEDRSIEEPDKPTEWISFPVDWENPEFRAAAQALIAPIQPLPLTLPPPDVISIALHVREGGDYDTDHTKRFSPLKLPPMHFYIEGMRQILELFPDRPLYCYVFTDAKFPSSVVDQIRDAFPYERRLTLDYRRTRNDPNLNVLEDFFSLFTFDILIHPLSNFSLIPALIHDYAVTFSPTAFSRKGDDPIRIVETKLKINEPLYQELLKK